MVKGESHIVKPPRDPQDVGYVAGILAVAVHLLVVIFSLVKLPSMSAEQTLLRSYKRRS